MNNTPLEFYLQTAPEPMPNRAFDPQTGAAVHPDMIRIVEGLRRAMERQRQAQQEKQRGAGTRTRYTKGGYASQSGRERNMAAAYERQYRMMQNNPHMQMGDPRGQAGYYVNGRHIPQMGPDGVLR